jgi:hypothetical protein
MAEFTTRELGLLSGRPNINMKVEEQAGQAPKITSTFSSEPSAPINAPNAATFAFDPMEFWSGISSVVDSEFERPTQRLDLQRQGLVDLNQQNIFPPQRQMAARRQDMLPENMPLVEPGMGDPYRSTPSIPDPTALAFPNMPYNATGASLPPPAVDTPMGTGYGTPMRYGVGQDAQDVIMTPSTTAAPMDYGIPENYGVTQQVEAPYTGDAPSFSSQELGMDAMTAAELDANVGDPGLFSPIDDPEWVGVQEQAGVDVDTQKKTSAATVSAINEPAVPLSNNVNGQDASQNPIMSGQIFDPRQRQAEYLKQMNTIMMGGLMLDLAAAALGVKSRSGSYMDGQLKILEQQMKFDDQARIYDATKAVYYPDGVYQNPGTQADVFDSLMGTGMVSPAEASAISGYHPEGSSGYDTHYSVELSEDGTAVIKPVYVPKGTIPQEGTFPNATVAQYEAERLSGGSGTSAGKNFSQWRELSAAIAEAEAAGDPARVKKAKAELDAFERINKMVGIGGEPTFGNALKAYDSQFKTMQNAATEDGMSPENTFRKRTDPNDPDSELVYIPWGQFQRDWLRNWSLNVVTKNANGDDVDVVIPGWLQLSAPWRTEELPTTKRVASPSKILELQEIIEDGGITIDGEFVTVEQVKKEWNETFTVPWDKALGQGQ